VVLQRKVDGLSDLLFFLKKSPEVESRYHSYELETLAIAYEKDFAYIFRVSLSR